MVKYLNPEPDKANDDWKIWRPEDELRHNARLQVELIPSS